MARFEFCTLLSAGVYNTLSRGIDLSWYVLSRFIFFLIHWYLWIFVEVNFDFLYLELLDFLRGVGIVAAVALDLLVVVNFLLGNLSEFSGICSLEFRSIAAIM